MLFRLTLLSKSYSISLPDSDNNDERLRCSEVSSGIFKGSSFFSAGSEVAAGVGVVVAAAAAAGSDDDDDAAMGAFTSTASGTGSAGEVVFLASAVSNFLICETKVGPPNTLSSPHCLTNGST